MARRLTFRQYLNIGALKEKDLGKVFLLGVMLLRNEKRPLRSYEQEKELKEEILSMNPEEFFAELERDVRTRPEKFSGPGPERVKKMIAEARAIIPVDEIREGKIRQR